MEVSGSIENFNKAYTYRQVSIQTENYHQTSQLT